jgi:hypothetical protein
MPHENFRIRIKKDGTIQFASRQLDAEQMRNLREMLEDCLGRVTEVRAADGDELPPAGVGYADEEKAKEVRQRSG